MTKTNASAKKSTKSLDKKNLKNQAEKAVDKTAKEPRVYSSIYIYPKDATTALAKKAFRRKARQEKRKLEKAIQLGKGHDKEEAKKAMEKFVKHTYSEKA